MSSITVRLGFVPSYRFGYTDWCQKMRDDSLAAFSRIPGLEVVVPLPLIDGQPVSAATGQVPYGMVNNLDQAEIVIEYFRQQKVDGLILCPLDFGDERSAVKIAEALAVPVLLYATKEPAGRQDPGLTRVSDSYCGNLSMASGLYRRKIPFHYAGIYFPDEPELAQAVVDFTAAAAVVKGLRGARIGQVGLRPPSFETVAYDEVALVQKFMQSIIYADLSEITERARRLPEDDATVQQILTNIRRSAPTISVAEDHLLNAARLEAALTLFFMGNHLSAMGVQCWPVIQRQMGISMCALYGRLTDQGMLTACETDILGALSMLVNYQAALGTGVPHFIDWTIQHRKNENWLLAWHCGNAPASLAADPGSVALRSRRSMTGELPATLGDDMAGLYQFQVKPGRVTFCRLAEYDNQWKMLIAGGEIIPSNETLAGTWSWVEIKDQKRLYRTLVEEGFIHHASMVHGDQRASLLQACKFLDIQPILVD